MKFKPSGCESPTQSDHGGRTHEKDPRKCEGIVY
jgi:hypothetical protein